MRHFHSYLLCLPLLEILHHLLARVVDPENFYHQCVLLLPEPLRKPFIERVGWLNILDVMQPNLSYDLDFRNLDHWKVGHVLTQLAATEDGVNFVNQSFRRDHLTDPIAGWDLPSTWDVQRYTGNLPRGVPHQCRASGTAPSIHVSFGSDVHIPLTWEGALHCALRRRQASARRKRLGVCLP